MSQSETLLLPNLGAEEGEHWRSFATLPAVATTARLWRWLFAPPTRIVGLGASAQHQEGWPSQLGPRPSDAIFAWLDASNTLTPWLASVEAAELCQELGRELSAPDAAVVSRVHDKAFAQQQAGQLGYQPRELAELIHIFEPNALAKTDTFLADLAERLLRWPDWTGGRFTLKPRMGTSGRGRVASEASRLDAAAVRGALPRLAACGGALLEPWLDRVSDLSVLLHVDPAAPASAGRTRSASPITLLGSLEQLVTPAGLCLGHLGEVDSRGRIFSGSPHEEAVREAAAALANAARETGFSGPCGVDSFVFRVRANETDDARLRPVVELNARFTLGIVALGLVRRVLGQLREALGLEPGQRRAFLFALDTPVGWQSWQSRLAQLGEGTRLVPLWQPDDASRPALLFTRRLVDLHEAVRAA